MRISVDLTICESHGQCVFAAPGHFAFDDDDNLEVLSTVAESAEDRAAVTEAAAACPVAAITLFTTEGAGAA